MYGDQAAASEAEVRAQLSDTIEGICVGYDWPNRLVIVNIGGALQSMPWAGEAPWRGDRVRVIVTGNKPMCFAVWGSAMGTVSSVASSIATVTGDDGAVYRYPTIVGDTISAGHRVRLDHAGRVVAGRYAAEPEGVDPTTPGGPPASGSGKATFRPTNSANFRNGVFDTQFAEISSTRSAAYYYGRQIDNTIPDGATITKAEIRLVELWDQVPGTASHMGTHTHATRGSEPVLSGSINVLGGGSINIMAFANALKTGAALGIGFAKNTGWRRFDTFARSGSIYMEWRS